MQCFDEANITSHFNKFFVTLILFSAEEKKLDAEVHRQHIFGLHVANYMRVLEEEDNEAFKRQFSKYIALGVRADDVSINSVLSVGDLY